MIYNGCFLTIFTFLIEVGDSVGSETCPHPAWIYPSSQETALRSPGYPNGYNSNFRLCYIFKRPTKNDRVVLRISHLLLPSSSSCTSGDYVRVYDGILTFGGLLRTLCGYAKDILIDGTNDYLTLYLRTDAKMDKNQAGFLLYHKYIKAGQVGGESCSSTALYPASLQEKSLRSPGYPNGYARNLRKCYRFYTPSITEEIVILRIANLRMPSSSPCTSDDYVMVHDGLTTAARKMKTLCGKVTDITIVSTGRYLLLYFSTDNTTDTNQAGFLLYYRYVSTRLIRACPTVTSLSASTSKKELTSPGYPSATGAYMTYCWLVSTNQQYYRVHVEVLETSMVEPINGTCERNDFVEGRESTKGSSSSGSLLERWCGTRTVDFSTQGQYLFIRFQTGSSSKTSASFRLQYWAESRTPVDSGIFQFNVTFGFLYFGVFIFGIIFICLFVRKVWRRCSGSDSFAEAGVAVINVNNVGTAHAPPQPACGLNVGTAHAPPQPACGLNAGTAHAPPQPAHRPKLEEYPPQSYPQPSQTSPQNHIAYPRYGSPSPLHGTSQLSNNGQCSQMAPQYNPPQSYPQSSQTIPQYHTGYPLPGSSLPSQSALQLSNYGQCSQMVPQYNQLPGQPTAVPSAPPPPYSSLYPVSTEPGCYGNDDNGQVKGSFPPAKGHVPQP